MLIYRCYPWEFVKILLVHLAKTIPSGVKFVIQEKNTTQTIETASTSSRLTDAPRLNHSASSETKVFWDCYHWSAEEKRTWSWLCDCNKEVSVFLNCVNDHHRFKLNLLKTDNTHDNVCLCGRISYLKKMESAKKIHLTFNKNTALFSWICDGTTPQEGLERSELQLLG